MVRYFTTLNDEVIWGDSREELLDRYGDLTHHDIKSFTFILASVFDNKILLEKDPGYLGNLKAQPLVERERLLGGNWKIRPSAGLYFKRSYFEIVDAAPANARRVRCWDLAATDAERGQDARLDGRHAHEPRPAGDILHRARRALPGQPREGRARHREHRGRRRRAGDDPHPQDPGQAGKYAGAIPDPHSWPGYNIRTKRVTGDKVTRASPASAQAEAGNIKVVRGPWNEAFFAEAENFPGGAKDDQIDALSDCIDELASNDIGDRPMIRRL